MKIGKTEINTGSAGLAPMAGVADRAYRILCKKFGSAFVVSEMVSAKGLCYSDKKTELLCSITEIERPMAIQLFGSEPEYMAKATLIVNRFNPDIIDINMGCPVAKVIKQGAGSVLMRTPKIAADLVKSVKDNTDKPVTVKIRTGWDDKNINAPEFAELMQKSGADAITIHGRTKQQLYSGKISLDIIKKVKQSVDIPVIGNGDINCKNDIEEMYQATGCDFVMIGRGSYGNPWIFSQNNDTPTLEERLEVCKEHVNLLLQNYDEVTAVRMARRVVSYYLKGLRNSAYFRNLCHGFNNYEDVLRLLSEISNS